MSSVAFVLSALLTAPGNPTATLVNSHVWQSLKATGTVAAPTGELSGLAALAASGISLPEKALARVGGESSAAATLLGSLRATDKAVASAGVLVASDSSAWSTNGSLKDPTLESYGLELLNPKATTLRQDTNDWLNDRVEMPAPAVASTYPNQITTAAQYVVPPSSGFFPKGKMSFEGQKVSSQSAAAQYWVEDEISQVAIMNLANSRYVLVFASPVAGKSPSDVVTHFQSDWKTVLEAAGKEQVEVTLPIFSTTVDRDLTETLDMKAQGLPGVRERLLVGIGIEPPVPPIQRKGTGVSSRMNSFIRMPIWHMQPPLAFASSFSTGTTSQRKEPRRLLLDHPFVYALADGQTGQVVFAGICSKP